MNFQMMKKYLEEKEIPLVSLACAQDEEGIKTLKAAYEEGVARAIFVGDKEKIIELMEKDEFPYEAEIIHEPDDKAAASIAVSIVKEGRADVLMKGLINTSVFLHEVLSKEHKYKGGLLSHLAAFSMPGRDKLVFHTDGGINIAPDLNAKKQILNNALSALHSIGIVKPKVAVLTANEAINPKMPATTDAEELSRMHKSGSFPGCILEGPITMDVALSRKAARLKGIESRVSGDVDLFLMPNIEAGNITGKALAIYAEAKFAGMVLGTGYPIVLTSRAEDAEGKLNSLILACYTGRGIGQSDV